MALHERAGELGNRGILEQQRLRDRAELGFEGVDDIESRDGIEPVAIEGFVHIELVRRHVQDRRDFRREVGRHGLEIFTACTGTGPGACGAWIASLF